MDTRALLIVLVASVSVITLSRAENGAEDDDDDPPITYECDPTELLILYNRSSSEVRMHCSHPPKCGSEKTCVTSITPSCEAKSQYLAGVKEQADGSVVTTCCQITPPIEGEEPCYEVNINDPTDGAMFSTTTVKPGIPSATSQQSGHPRVVRAPLSPPSPPSPPAAAPPSTQPTKPTTPVTFQEKVDLMLFDLHDRRAPVELVKGIYKTPKGYRVKVCAPQCQPTTSSTSTVSAASTTPTVSTRRITTPQNDERTVVTDAIVGRPNGGQNQPTPPPGHKLRQGTVGQGCFSGDMTVITPSGPRRMDQLHVGDKVVVLTGESARKYQPIEWFYHRDVDQLIEFVILKTESGRILSLTPNHLIPLFPCTDKQFSLQQIDKIVTAASFFASRAKVGHCVASSLTDSVFMADRIVQIRREHRRGIFSPITSQGTILVNGIQASCYSSLENQSVQRSIHSVLIKANRTAQWIWHWLTGQAENMEDKEIPTVLALLLSLAKNVLPTYVYA